MAVKPSLSLEKRILNLKQNGYEIADRSNPIATFDFSLGTSSPSTTFGFTDAQKAAARLALALWDDVSGLDFLEVSSGGRLRLYNDSTIPAAGSGALISGEPGPNGLVNVYTQVVLNPTISPQTANPVTGQYGFFVLLHEIGHGLGLSHPQSYPSNATYELNATYAEDTMQYTIMSYFYDDQNRGTFFNGSLVQTPMIDDIAALQSIYGVSKNTRATDTVYGFRSTADRSVFDFSINTKPVLSFVDSGGKDTIDLSGFTSSQFLNLNSGSFSNIGGLTGNVGIAYTTLIENGIGGSGSDTILGNDVSNELTGGGGNDSLDGGDGIDISNYSATSQNYIWQKTVDGAWSVKDLRAGSPDGVDTLRNIEILRFTDKAVAIITSLSTVVETAFGAIMRASSSAVPQSLVSANIMLKVASGQSDSQAIAEVIKAADATTSVATMSYAFFTGKIPSLLGIDYLVSPTGPNVNNLNGAYYQNFNLENRYINFAVNLGKIGEGKDAFAAKYGSMNLFDATREAYKTIFGAAPTDAKIHSLIDTRADYFASYGGDGVNGQGTKAAMVGWLLAEAEKADLGVMARSNAAWLADLSDGSAPFAINILDPASGYWKADFVFGGS